MPRKFIDIYDLQEHIEQMKTYYDSGARDFKELTTTGEDGTSLSYLYERLYYTYLPLLKNSISNILPSLPLPMDLEGIDKEPNANLQALSDFKNRIKYILYPILLSLPRNVLYKDRETNLDFIFNTNFNYASYTGLLEKGGDLCSLPLSKGSSLWNIISPVNPRYLCSLGDLGDPITETLYFLSATSGRPLPIVYLNHYLGDTVQAQMDESLSKNIDLRGIDSVTKNYSINPVVSSAYSPDKGIFILYYFQYPSNNASTYGISVGETVSNYLGNFFDVRAQDTRTWEFYLNGNPITL